MRSLRRPFVFLTALVVILLLLPAPLWGDTETRLWTDPDEGKTMDFARLYIWREFGLLVVQTDTWRPIELNDLDSGNLLFLLNVDESASTGSPQGGSGAEYRVRIAQPKPGDFDPGFPDFFFDAWTTGQWVQTKEMGGSAGSSAFTSTLQLADLGNPSRVGVVALSLSTQGSVLDRVPDVGQAVYYVEGQPPITTTSSTTTTLPSTTTTLPPTTTTTVPVPTPTTTSTTLPPAPGFTDVGTSHPYHTAISGMHQAGIIDGYLDGSFRPDNPVLRQHFAKMIVGALSIPVNEGLVAPFGDLGADDPGDLYPHDYIAAAAAYGITNGTVPGHFSPWADITRAQVVTMIVRGAQSLKPGTLATPPAGYTGSISSFSGVHSPNMRMAEYNALMTGLVGFGPGWNPWAKATRGEVAQLLWNLWER